jgi:hypothetical protein
VGSIQIRHLDIYSRNEKVYGASIGGIGEPIPVDITVSLHPGKNELRFQTDRAGAQPGNGDRRKLAFSIKNFKVLD